MSKLMARPDTVAKAIKVTEAKIVQGYERGFRFAETNEQRALLSTLSEVHGVEHSLLSKLKALQPG
jgi:hypothetical protein